MHQNSLQHLFSRAVGMLIYNGGMIDNREPKFCQSRKHKISNLHNDLGGYKFEPGGFDFIQGGYDFKRRGSDIEPGGFIIEPWGIENFIIEKQMKKYIRISYSGGLISNRGGFDFEPGRFDFEPGGFDFEPGGNVKM